MNTRATQMHDQKTGDAGNQRKLPLRTGLDRTYPKTKDRRALKPKVKGKQEKEKAKVESDPVNDDTASSEEAQAEDAPTIQVAPPSVDVDDPSHLWRPVLCRVKCDRDESVSTPFERAGPIAGAPVKQIAASRSSKVVQGVMAGKTLEMLDAPHSTASTLEGVALRFPPPRTGSAGNDTALAECV